MKLAQKITTSVLATLLTAFNAFDTLFSLKYIKFGPLYEANPIMAWLLSIEPFWFVFYKLGIVTICICLLSFYSYHKIARVMLYIMFVIYSLIMFWWAYVIFLFQ